VTLDFNSVHGVMSPEAEVFITIVVGTPNHTIVSVFIPPINLFYLLNMHAWIVTKFQEYID
jgi:hypothetical protein